MAYSITLPKVFTSPWSIIRRARSDANLVNTAHSPPRMLQHNKFYLKIYVKSETLIQCFRSHIWHHSTQYRNPRVDCMQEMVRYLVVVPHTPTSGWSHNLINIKKTRLMTRTATTIMPTWKHLKNDSIALEFNPSDNINVLPSLYSD